ncbi:MAG: alpha/beta hydrolase fold domain-containing protein, partial [Selenomonadaceae bacterium]|nr:alpha/beta hydrolase fold domain-containing protein [Selenomonadaceae bacterium]
MKKKFLAGLLSLSLLFGSTAFAAPAWKLPASGKTFSDDNAEQTYIADYMEKFFHGKIKVKFAAPDGWTYKKFSVNGVKVEHLTNSKKKSARVVLQLHGGGYVDGLGDLHRDFAVKQMVLSDAREGYIVDYRLAPENVYPAALDDAFAAYEEILNRGVDPKNLIVFGDSAGGNLALELSLLLKEKNLPQPALLILHSPWTTLETDLPSRAGNSERDLILGVTNPHMYNEVCNPTYGGKISLSDPRLSPIHADLTGLPPMLILVGGHEIFVDEGIVLLIKATEDEFDVTL